MSINLEDNLKQCINYIMEPKTLSDLTMYFIDAFNKLAFSSEVRVELANINKSTNLC